MGSLWSPSLMLGCYNDSLTSPLRHITPRHILASLTPPLTTSNFLQLVIIVPGSMNIDVEIEISE